MEIDFSQAHFLDHSIFDPYCATQYGGRRKHLEYAYQFKWRPDVLSWVRSHSLCQIGHHTPSQWWKARTGETREETWARMRSGSDHDGVSCSACGKRLN